MTAEQISLKGESLVTDWQTSGMTQVEYARLKNIKIHTLRYWLYKRNKKSQQPEAFVELRNILNHNSVILRYPNGVEMHLPAEIPVVALKSLINL